jgi:hypothetical protein
VGSHPIEAFTLKEVLEVIESIIGGHSPLNPAADNRKMNAYTGGHWISHKVEIGDHLF